MRRRGPAIALALACAAALGAGAATAAAQSAAAGPQIQRSSAGWAGRTVIAWSAPYAQFLARSTRTADCDRGQRSLVRFVPATMGPNQRTSCTAEVGQGVMVTPAAVVCTAPDRGFCTAPRRINDVRRVRVAIDGAPLTIRNFDWVSRQAFEIGGDAGAVGGYMYIITGLAPGTHTIETSARIDTGARTRDFRLTATVTVG